ncbi:MAG TPA: isoaspartyl peptidase/L-asparaginase, partial [Panacibacter sp.]|nr:isoaspartyl peptidase/L-asparaginase [Panacibacter sp.]
MLHRRSFLQMGSLGLTSFSFLSFKQPPAAVRKPIVISTWDAGINANEAAWNVLRKSGRALDAVEQGVMVTEAEQGCCVGLGANPDRDG